MHFIKLQLFQIKKYGLFLWLLVGFNLQAQQTWTLQACIDYALAHHPEIQQQKTKITNSNLLLKQAKYDFLPALSFNANQGFNLGNTYNISTGVGQKQSSFTGISLNADVVLFNGLLKHYQLKKHRISLEEAQAGLQNKKLELTRQIIETFLSAALHKAEIEYWQAELSSMKKSMDIARQLTQKHLKPLTELYSLKSEYQKMELQHIQIAKDYKNILIKLSALIGIKDSLHINITDTNNYKIESVKFDTENFPAVKQLKKHLMAEQYQLKILKSKLYPNLSLRYSFYTNYYHIIGQPDIIYNQTTNQWETNGWQQQFQNNRLHYIGLSLHIPVFYGFKNRLQIKIKQNQLKELRSGIAYKQNEIEKIYQQLKNEVKTSQQKLQLLDKNLALNQQLLDIATQKWQKSLLSVLDYLQIKRQYTQAMLKRLQEAHILRYKKRILNILNQASQAKQ